jgi:hypothetical protein
VIFFVLFLFCFNALFQFTPLLNLRSLIFDLTPFSELLSITITPYFCREYHSLFRPFWFTLTSSGVQLGRKTSTKCSCVLSLYNCDVCYDIRVPMERVFFWVVSRCNLAGRYRHFGGICCHFYPEDGNDMFLRNLLRIYQTVRCHIPDRTNTI